MHLKSADTLKEQLENLPIIGEGNWISCLFNLMDEEKKNLMKPRLRYTLVGYPLSLKSLSQLKLSLVKHFNESKYSLFETLQTPARNGCRYTLVPAILNSLHWVIDWWHTPSIRRLPVDLNLLSKLHFPIFQSLFEKLFLQGERNFILKSFWTIDIRNSISDIFPSMTVLLKKYA